jgi:phenylalanyl-tRNA synthetase beta chain
MKETNEISPYAKKESYAKIYFRGKEIGEIGKMNTETAENYSLKKPVYFFDFSLEDFSLSEKPKEFLPFSPLPSSFRDQNITLEKTVLESDFLAKIQKNVPYLVSVKIIDRYTGKGVEETKKRLTVSAEYQSPEKTLTEEEIVLAHEVLVKNMEICI